MTSAAPLQPGDVVRYRVDTSDAFHQGEITEVRYGKDDQPDLVLVRPDRSGGFFPRLALKFFRRGTEVSLFNGKPIQMTVIAHRAQTARLEDQAEVRRLRRWLDVLRELVEGEVADTTTRAILDQCIERALAGESINGEDHERTSHPAE